MAMAKFAWVCNLKEERATLVNAWKRNQSSRIVRVSTGSAKNYKIKLCVFINKIFTFYIGKRLET